MRLEKRPPAGSKCFVLVDLGEVVTGSGYWTDRESAEAEADSRNDLPDVAHVLVGDNGLLHAID